MSYMATAPIIKKGPFGSTGGSVKDMNPTGITRIVRITIHHGDTIEALIVHFERDGTIQCTDQWGGYGGNVTKINLKTNEYITCVKGYFNGNYNGHEVVMSLKLETNLAIYGPYGKEEGELFELPAIEGQIIGFHARYGKYVNAVGIYVQATGSIIKKGPFGGDGGIVKDMDPTDITRIVKITIYHDNVINSLIVYFERNGTPQCTERWGGDGGNMSEINLNSNEYITHVEGYFNDKYHGHKVVASLTLKTNLTVYGPYGKENGQFFEFPALNGKIIGFYAHYERYVNAIGVYVQATGPIIKKEPFGGDGEKEKDMDPTGITRIEKITILHDEVIEAITVYFERNGTIQCTDRWGGDGGIRTEVTEIILATNEYITYVKGYINDDYNGQEVLMALMLETNLSVYGPYGREEGEYFELPAYHGKIIGFHARHGKYINAVGVYVQATSPIIKKGPFGAPHGIVKDMDPMGITRIVEITIYHSDVIDALTVCFERNGATQCTDRWGGDGGTKTEKPTKASFMPLVKKFESRLQGWRGKLLSRGGRLQLVNSVLSSLPIYYMNCFRIPRWAIKRMDKVRRLFLWGKNENEGRGISLINWETACMPKEWGGLGIRNLEIQNISLLLRWWWRLYQQSESLWRFWASRLRGSINRDGGITVWLRSGSFFWVQLLNLKSLFHSSTQWNIGNGNSISFWFDNWQENPLRRYGDGLSRPIHSKFSLAQALPRLSELLPDHSGSDLPILSSVGDVLMWKWESSGEYSSKSLYTVLMSVGKVSWRFNKLWSAKCPCSAKIFMFLVLNGRILTQDMLLRRHIDCQVGCIMCSNGRLETSLHLLFKCRYAVRVWRMLSAKLGINLIKHGATIQDIWILSTEALRDRNHRGLKEKIWISWFTCTTWAIWKQRNERVFRGSYLTPEILVSRILNECSLWLNFC